MINEHENPREDALTEVLETLRIRGRVCIIGDFISPWAIEQTSRCRIYLYVIESGSGTLKFKSSEKETAFTGGDLLLISGGEDHIIYDGSPDDPASVNVFFGEETTTRHFLRIGDEGNSGDIDGDGGGGGDAARIIGGTFTFKYPDNPHLTEALPPLIHIRAEDTRPDINLARLLTLLFEELQAADIGKGMTIDRLTELILVRAIRIWIKSRREQPANWLGALGDKRVRHTLDILHQTPETHWTIARIGSEVARTESNFLSKFTRLVGVPPIRYLTNWRLHLAAGYIQSGEVNVGDAGIEIGFGTRDGFSRSFANHFGKPPNDFKPK